MPSLRIVTWNLQGSKGPDIVRVVARLRERSPDVVALQEVQRHQARAIGRALGWPTVSWHFKHWPVRTWPEGLAVLSRVPVRHVQATRLSRARLPWQWQRRIAVAEVLDAGGADVLLIDVHLAAHAGAEAERLAEVERLLAMAAAMDPASRDLPWLVLGDLNVRPNDPVIARLVAAGLRDAYVARHPDEDEAASATNWSGPRSVPPDQRIDYVLASEGLEAVEAFVPHVGDPGWDELPTLSDHLPLTVSVSLPTGPADPG